MANLGTQFWWNSSGLAGRIVNTSWSTTSSLLCKAILYYHPPSTAIYTRYSGLWHVCLGCTWWRRTRRSLWFVGICRSRSAIGSRSRWWCFCVIYGLKQFLWLTPLIYLITTSIRRWEGTMARYTRLLRKWLKWSLWITRSWWIVMLPLSALSYPKVGQMVCPVNPSCRM